MFHVCLYEISHTIAWILYILWFRMANNENSGELNKKSTEMPVQKSKLKIKRFRRKDGEKKAKRDPNTPKHPLTG